MNLVKLPQNKVLKDILLMLFFGVLSFVLGTIQFNIPSVEGATSDFREVPLLISVFYFSNPLYTIGVSLITAFGTSSDGSYITTLVIHSVGLIASWYVYNGMIRKNPRSNASGVIWLIFTFIYYYILIIPILIITNFLVGLNSHKNFLDFYFEMASMLWFEAVSSAIITSLYLIQHKIREKLTEHQLNLENLVKKRTEELLTTIEDLKATQLQLIQSEKMASMGTLTAGVAHEINNPLNFISGSVQIINDIIKEINQPKIEKRYNEAIKILSIGVQKITDIVDALMTFSYNGKPVLIRSDIHGLIDKTLFFFNIKIPKDIKIIKDYQLKSDVQLYPEKMLQVIINILNNAFFSINNNNGGEKIITIKTFEKNEKGIIEIVNTGDPIPEESINRIFDPFYTTKNPNEGKGLGLSICYKLVNEHNGTLVAKNHKSGVSFIIELPI